MTREGLKEGVARKKKEEYGMYYLRLRQMMTNDEQQIPEPEPRDTHERHKFTNAKRDIDIDDVIYERPDSETDQSLPILIEIFCTKTFRMGEQ